MKKSIPITLQQSANSSATTATAAQSDANWWSESLPPCNLGLKVCTAGPYKAATQMRCNKEAQWESELRLLSAALMSVQERERKRISIDLHDSIGQSLGALSCGIGAALDGVRKGDAETASVMLENLAEQVKTTIGEVRRIAMNMRPAMLDDIGLIATLSWFFREFRSLHPELALTYEIDIEESDIQPAWRSNVFRVVQEAMNNIVKHAGANAIHIHMQRVAREVHLEITDNGAGFAIEDVSRRAVTDSGMGLKGMRDRMESCGCRFCIVSVPGKGTRIFAALPIPPQ